MDARQRRPMTRRDMLRLVAGAAGASTVMSLLAACGGAAQAPATGGGAAPAAGATAPAAGATAAPAAAASGAQVTISMMGWGSPLEKANVDEGLKLFQSKNPDIKVDWLHTPEDYETKLKTTLAGGTPPDVFWAGNMLDYVARGVVLDVTERVKSDPVLGKADYFLEPQETDRTTYNGKWYGIGSCWVIPHMYYNVDLLQKAGVEPPSYDADKAWTWDQFLDAARKLTLDGNGKHPEEAGFDANNIVQYGVSWPTWSMMRDLPVFSNGGESFTKDLTIKLGEPAATEGIQLLADLANKHHVAPQAVVSTQLGISSSQMLATGKLGLLIDGSWALQDIAKLGFKYGAGVLPKVKEAVTIAQAHIHVIDKDTKNPDAAWKLLAFLASDDYQRGLCKVGLWLPSHTSLLTKDGLASWITPGVHPEGYEKIATDYLAKHAKNYFYPAGFAEADKIISSALDPVWIGQKTAAEALTPDVIQQATDAIKNASSKLK